MLGYPDAMAVWKAREQKFDFLARVLLVRFRVEDQRNTQSPMHEGPEQDQDAADGGEAELSGFQNTEVVNVVLQAGEDLPEESLLRAIEDDLALALFLGVDDDVRQEVGKGGLEGLDTLFVPAGDLLLCSRSTEYRSACGHRRMN